MIEERGREVQRLHKILEDDFGYIWLSGNNGVFRARKHDLDAYAEGRRARVLVSAFGRSDGMRSSECNGGGQPAGWKTRDGRICFPTVKGLAIIDPRDIRTNQQPPTVIVEDVLIDYVPVSPGDVPVIDPGKQNLELRYTALSFVAPEKIAFKYMLEGYDRAWVVAGTRRAAYYTNIPPGGYTFRVQACNSDGIWNEEGTSLQLVVRPPFWVTWWFRLAVGVIAVATVVAAVRFVSTRKLRLKLRAVEAQHALDRERMRISKDMHDDLGASLSKITLLGELAFRHSSRKKEVEKDLERIIGASRDATNAMDEIVWAVNPQNDTAGRMLTYLCQYAKEYLSLCPIRCRIEVPDILPNSHVSAEVRHNTFLVIKEALSNIARHSQATDVTMSVAYAEHALSIFLEDNGKGIPAERGNQFGNGLQNMRQRIAEIGGSLDLESAPNRGTRLRIVIAV